MYKILFGLSLFANVILGLTIFLIPIDYYKASLKQCVYLHDFQNEIIQNHKIKLDPTSRFMKGYRTFDWKGDSGESYREYLFDMNENIEVSSTFYSKYGFDIGVDENNYIRYIGPQGP